MDVVSVILVGQDARIRAGPSVNATASMAVTTSGGRVRVEVVGCCHSIFVRGNPTPTFVHGRRVPHLHDLPHDSVGRPIFMITLDVG